MNTIPLHVIRVCVCCMLTYANGECCEMHNAGAQDETNPLPWTLWANVTMSEHPTMGLLAEDHDCDFDATREGGEGCECEQAGFSWNRCQGCGSPLGGDRFYFTLTD